MATLTGFVLSETELVRKCKILLTYTSVHEIKLKPSIDDVQIIADGNRRLNAYKKWVKSAVTQVNHQLSGE